MDEMGMGICRAVIRNANKLRSTNFDWMAQAEEVVMAI